MKKLSVIFAAIAIASMFVLSACTGDPVKSTQKDMLKYGEFVCVYGLDDDKSHDFKLTMNKDNTFSLYIKDFDKSNDNVVMLTYIGNWSHVFTYDYKYTRQSAIDLFKTSERSTLGVYLLKGYYRTAADERDGLYAYFVYEKSEGKGVIHCTAETINEEYMKKNRKEVVGIGSGEKGKVQLNGFEFEAD